MIMRVAVYLPLLFSGALALLSPFVARRLPPAVATRVLSAASGLSALASSWGLILLATSAAGWLPELPERAHISRVAWTSRDPAPLWAGVLAVLTLLVGLTRLATVHSRHRIESRAAAAVCGRSADTELVVLDDDRPRAFAVPGRDSGRIVVSAGMLRLLSAWERRVLFAHERAHLTWRHHRYRRLTAVSAAINPLLCRVRDDVGFTCERWADEEAGRSVGDRVLAARALARAAIATLAEPGPALAFARLNVEHRVAALQRPAPGRGPALMFSCVVVAVSAWAASGEATFAFARFLASVVPAVRDVARATGW
jgi:hypothetical protein